MTAAAGPGASDSGRLIAMKSAFFSGPHPRIIAHRGASAAFPENTMPAFAAAADLGVAYIELDVHMTRDGRIAVAHDGDLERVAGRPGRIAELTFDELRAYDAGYNFVVPGRAGFPFRGAGVKIPELAEVFARCQRQRFIIEIKQSSPSLTTRLLAELERAGMTDRVLIASEHQEPIDEIRAAAPFIPTNLPSPEIGEFFRALPSGAAPYLPRGAALQIPPEYHGWKLATPESVAAAHRAGLEVHVFTVNDAAEMRALLQIGVDGIITDSLLADDSGLTA